jgi:hypothetical protein
VYKVESLTPEVPDKDRIEELLLLRHRAKVERNFIEADSIRDELASLRVIVRDVPNGVVWKQEDLYVQPKKGITDHWREKLAPLYRRFAPLELDYDWSEEAMEEAYLCETRGEGRLSFNIFANTNDKFNGYAVGKKYMDVTLAMWRSDIEEGLLTKNELYAEMPEEFHWWLDGVLASVTLKKSWAQRTSTKS